MTRRLAARSIAAVLCSVVAFLVIPALCLYVDDCHLNRDPSCPYCKFIVTYVAVIALAAPIFILVSLRAGLFGCQRTVPCSCARRIGLPFVRAPPLRKP